MRMVVSTLAGIAGTGAQRARGREGACQAYCFFIQYPHVPLGPPGEIPWSAAAQTAGPALMPANAGAAPHAAYLYTI
ncbi:exported hypothetical protein [Cupriavidus taiwanensis]|nr:exported hypothetical protein [Cupriavidus taiwanensis]